MPDGWREVLLGDAVEVTMGRQRAPKYAQGDHVVPYLRAANVKDGHLELSDVLEMNFAPAEQETFALKPGDVLVTEGCGSIKELGASARWDDELPGVVCFQNTLLRLRAVEGVTDSGFLEVWARHAYASGLFASVASGTNIFHIGSTRAKRIPLLLPPLDEQRRIADLAGAIQALQDAADGEVAALRAVADAIAQHGVWSPEVDRHRVRDLACERGLVGGPFGSSLVSKDYAEDGVPVIRGTNMPGPGERFVRGPFAYVTEAKANSLQRNVAEPGDVVFTQRGTLGQVGLVPERGHDRYVVSQSQMRIRTDVARALPEYVYVVFRTPRMVANVVSRNTATANPHINLGILGELELPVPSLDDQRKIVDVYFAAEDAIEQARAVTRSIAAARDAILHEVLSAKHQIPDTYDELLELAS